MKTTFLNCIKNLIKISGQFDDENNLQKLHCLKQLSAMKLPGNKLLQVYHNALLFNCAYPSYNYLLTIAEGELNRIAVYLKKKNKGLSKFFDNTGLPFTKGVCHYSHDCVVWLLSHPHCKPIINSYYEPMFHLNEVLKQTLPSLEISETTATLSNADLLKRLLVPPGNHLQFINDELSRLNEFPYMKDHFYDGLGLWLDLLPKDKYFSKAFNHIPVTKYFFHQELIRHFDFRTLINTPLPVAIALTKLQLQHAINVVKNAMALTGRETDPATYLDKQSFRLFDLERGISVAVYGMTPDRQLPLESYVGYTLFKNGFPASYGGGWLFGERSNFGINIFEWFRGGESGYIMCQLLRVYRQLFGINYFEVEPYQYGLDNPEGITSGAFWFYYRYGFRPLDKQLLKIANEEHVKIVDLKNYRTSKKTLIRFTKSNIALNFGKKIPIKIPDISRRVTQMIQLNYKGNRLNAEKDCVLRFKNKTGFINSLNKHENQVLHEVALWCEALGIAEKNKLNIMIQMIKTKPVDLYKYQELLLHFLGS